MNNKRFNRVGGYVYDGEQCISHFEDVKHRDDIVEILNALHEENEYYKAMFFELVETALTDKNCRELYCKGILDIFDKANSLNQARDMIKEHLR